MNLVQLHFTYEIPEKRFDYMSYEFNPIENSEDIKKTVDVAKSSLQDLELLIKSIYGKRIKKEENWIN